MIKVALEMLWIERKKAIQFCLSITTMLCVLIVFLQFFTNPNLVQKLTLFDLIFLTESLMIALLGFSILIVCVSLILYSFNYYMRTHSREIGLLKLAGLNYMQIVFYQFIQIIVIICVAYILCFLISLFLIPLSLYVIYHFCGIHQSIFFYSKKLIGMILMMFPIILIIILGLQIRYTLGHSISSLMKQYQSTESREIVHALHIPDFLYIVGYFLGLYTMFIGEELSAGFAIASCIGAISAYGLFYHFIPHTIEEMLSDLSLKGETYVILGDLSLFIQKSRMFIIFIMLAIILLPTFILSAVNTKLLYISLHISVVLVNIILSSSLISRFSIDDYEKKNHFFNLYKIGLTKDEVMKIAIKEIHYFYTILWIFTGIYIISIYIAFYLRTFLNIKIAFIILLEFMVPYIFSYIIVYISRRRRLHELFRNTEFNKDL